MIKRREEKRKRNRQRTIKKEAKDRKVNSKRRRVFEDEKRVGTGTTRDQCCKIGSATSGIS